MHACMFASMHTSGTPLQLTPLHSPFPKSTNLISRHTLPADTPLGKSDPLLQTYQHLWASPVPLALEEGFWGLLPMADHLFLYSGHIQLLGGLREQSDDPLPDCILKNLFWEMGFQKLEIEPKILHMLDSCLTTTLKNPLGVLDGSTLSFELSWPPTGIHTVGQCPIRVIRKKD